MTESLTRWNPFNELLGDAPRGLRDLVRDDFFQRFMTSPGEAWTPHVDLTEVDDGYELEGELPGVKAEDMKITLEGNVLTIRGEKRKEERRTEGQSHIVERSTGSFSRSFRFPTPVDPESVTAEAKDGVLSIKVRKKLGAAAKTIEVKAT